jgi:hypothetical protein
VSPFLDFSARCPACGDHHSRVNVIPPSVRTYILDGETVSDHFGELRDHKCGNCDHEWTMAEIVV